jgi:hypothetical protein
MYYTLDYHMVVSHRDSYLVITQGLVHEVMRIEGS